MTPVVIPSAGGDCFAMYRPAPGAAVLICPPFGDEALKTARVWRELALRLGEHGLASLRFDLPGNGNSAGEPTDPDRVESWRAAIRACAAWLASRHGGRVILFGHRFGALLALDAVGAGITVERLVLLDPPVSGATQARLLDARARLSENGSLPLPEGSDYVQAGGVPLSKATLRAIAALPTPLSGSALPPSFLVLPGKSPWPDQLSARGSIVETMPFEGHADFVPHDLFRATPPTAVLDRVVEYLVCAAIPSVVCAVATLPHLSELVFPDFTETPIQIGSDRQIFGILCRPDIPTSGPALLLPTSGADPCSGMSRIWTELARRLARDGITSLRFDMRGVGESSDATSATLIATVYAPDRVADLRAAIDFLAEQGFGSVNVVGYCAGAYASWHAALLDTRIVGILAGNLLYLNQLSALTDELLKLRPGESQIGLGENAIANKLSPQVVSLIRRLDDGARSVIPRRIRLLLRRWARDPIATRRHLAVLVSRGCSVNFVMSHDDHGHIRLRQAYGEQPVLPPGVNLTVIPDADHEFSNRHHRARFLELAASFALQRRPRHSASLVPATPARVLENV